MGDRRNVFSVSSTKTAMAGSTLVCTSIKTERRSRTNVGGIREGNQSFASGLRSPKRPATSSGGLAAADRQGHALLQQIPSLDSRNLLVVHMVIEFISERLAAKVLVV